MLIRTANCSKCNKSMEDTILGVLSWNWADISHINILNKNYIVCREHWKEAKEFEKSNIDIINNLHISVKIDKNQIIKEYAEQFIYPDNFRQKIFCEECKKETQNTINSDGYYTICEDCKKEMSYPLWKKLLGVK